jgi:hypothetical protein
MYEKTPSGDDKSVLLKVQTPTALAALGSFFCIFFSFKFKIQRQLLLERNGSRPSLDAFYYF